MKRLALAIALSLALISPGLGAEDAVSSDPFASRRVDHLFPATSFRSHRPWSPEEEIYHEMMKDGYTDDVLARVYEKGIHKVERLIGIRYTNDTYSIFVMQPRDFISRSALLRSLGRSVVNTRVDRCDIEVAKPLAQNLVDIWEKVLLGTRYAESEIGFEDAYAIFSMYSHTVRLPLEGQTNYYFPYRPFPTTSPGMLTSIAYKMADYCASKDPAMLADLERQVSQLQQRLAQ